MRLPWQVSTQPRRCFQTKLSPQTTQLQPTTPQAHLEALASQLVPDRRPLQVLGLPLHSHTPQHAVHGGGHAQADALLGGLGVTQHHTNLWALGRCKQVGMVCAKQEV